jgi:antitoxin component of RelBE/YafQ-DinJ toxin-antitoxin module
MPNIDMSTIISTKMATIISTMELPFDFLHVNRRLRPLSPKAAIVAVFSVISRPDTKTTTSLSPIA